MYWTAKRIKELKARGYRLRYMTLAEANAEVTSEELQAQEATSAKRVQPEVASNKQQAQESSSVKHQARKDTSHKHQATSK
tara:strand:- start:575 stop:817 length:243 start_codon:yes stop_codon:yes gene_type:complete